MRRRRSEQDFQDEIRSHIELETDRLIAEGVPADEARAQALRRFGDVRAARRRYAASQGGPGLENVLRDVGLAFRSVVREPGFAAAAVLTLALGIGLNTAIFSVVWTLTLRPLPLREADRVVTAHHRFAGIHDGGTSWMGDATVGSGSFSRRVSGRPPMSSWAEYLEYRAGTRALAGLTAFATIGLTLDAERPLAISARLVACDYFRVLQVRLPVGRGLVDDDCARPGAAPVVVLSDRFWRSHFGGDPSVLGREVTLNRRAFTVVGIAEPGFAGTELRMPALWLPVTMQPLLGDDRLSSENLSWLELVGRLRPGATVEQAAAELTVVAHRRDALYPGRNASVLVYPASLAAGPGLRKAAVANALAALVAAALIVGIGCLNIMNLLLARAPARQRAVRIRMALGASRRRIVSQLLTESLVLALLGGLAGVALATWAPPLIVATLPLQDLQLDLSADARVFSYAAAVSILAAAVFGVAPALETTRVDLATAMRGEMAAGARRGVPWLRQAVVSTQLAGSLLLLVLAALLARGLARAGSMDPGFAVDGIYSFQPELADQGYDFVRGAAFLGELRARTAALPGIESAALSTFLPLGPRSLAPFRRLDGNAGEGDAERASAEFNTVSSGYFETLGIAILRGRAFTREDESAAEPGAAVIGEAMARRFWPGEDALGRPFRVGDRTYNVVGIARDARSLSLAETDPAFFYAAAHLDRPLENAARADSAGNGRAAAWREPPGLSLVVRAADATALAAVHRAAAGIDPQVLVERVSLAERYDAVLRPARLGALFSGALGLLALALALVGVYGAAAWSASQRTREFGVRLALGAERRDIIRLALRSGLGPLVAGLAIGGSVAVAAAQVMRSLLFGVAPLDPVAFLGVSALLSAVALAAMYRPAARASRVDPARTLRCD